ncbi:uncharacterized protein LOC118503829 [Anopheles stephensi]|uniref:uncharacterized protein LOC118503829 n=1 Tax=Anopheles stephensi TaxID=30069 RepID=UPI0016588205|nr:uncharacterized protein LOC118503829 [Anopheles stephensi]
MKIVQTMATQTPARMRTGHRTRDRGVQMSEPKMVAPVGWKIEKYRRTVPQPKATEDESRDLKASETDQSQGCSEHGSSTSSASLDAYSIASEAYTSLSYEVNDQV